MNFVLVVFLFVLWCTMGVIAIRAYNKRYDENMIRGWCILGPIIWFFYYIDDKNDKFPLL